MPPELTSTEKAEFYANACRALDADTDLCLGSYAFTWGAKQETTATWFGVLLPNGNKLGAVDALTELWSGQQPDNLCPRITALALETPALAEPGSQLKAVLKSDDPDGDAMSVAWVLQRDAENYNTGGDAQAAPPSFPEAIVSGGLDGAEVKLPDDGGLYRLYAYLDDGKGAAAVGNLPVRVDAPERIPPSPRASLPFSVYTEAGLPYPYLPSGWMGNTGAIDMQFDCPAQPHAGATCLRAEYRAGDGWGGVVWQHPDNDWGDKHGGYDLTGATHLVFQARGERGGERITFGFGLLGRDKCYYDTAKGEIDITLTDRWHAYRIALANKDLSRIKTGFSWVVAGQGAPITFYLDDIRYVDGGKP